MLEGKTKNSGKTKPWLALRSSSIFIPLITASILLGCFLLYVFLYVSAQENYFNERSFRVLSVLNQKLAEGFESIREVLGASTGYDSLKKPGGKSPGKPPGGDDPENDSAERYVARQLESYGVTPDKMKVSWASGCHNAYRDGGLKLTEDDSTGPLLLMAEYPVGTPPPDLGCEKEGPKISVHLQPEVQIRPLLDDLNEGFFDDIFIADEYGKVLYQQSTGGDHVANLNELVRYKADGTPLIPLPAGTSASKDDNSAARTGQGNLVGPPRKAKAPSPASAPSSQPATSSNVMPFTVVSGFSNVVDIKLGGEAYKLYLQPSKLTVQEGSLRRRLVLCGLRTTKHANEETQALPSTIIIWGTLGVLSILALGWPLLKMSYVSPKERIKIQEFGWLIFTTLLAGALFSSVALNLTYRGTEDVDSRGHLKSLAGSINDQVRLELDQALKELDTISSASALDSLWPLPLMENREDWWAKSYYFRNRSTSYGPDFKDRYPWFRYAFWVDGNGCQQLKIGADSRTPRVNIAEEDYFKRIVGGYPPKQTVCKPLVSASRRTGDSRLQPDSAVTPPQFLMKPTYSPNNGEFLAIIGTPYARMGSGDANLAALNLKAQYLAIKFESLVNPVLPAGYGFAVLDSDGKVQFHSVAHRNLIEMFPQEMQSGQSELIALLAQGNSGFVNGEYLGKQQLLYVTPLQAFLNPPLTLVVFCSDEHFAESTQRTNVRFSILILIYIVALCAAAGVYLSRCSEYPLAAIWPEVPRQGIYMNIALTNCFLAIVFLFRYRTLDSFGALIAAFGLGMVAVVYPVGERESEGKAWRIATRAVVLTYLILLAGWNWQLLFAAAYAVYLGVFWNRFSYLPAFIRPKKNWLNYTYTILAASLVFTIIMVPSCGFFKFAYDHVELGALRREQVDLARTLDRRRERIQQEFQGLQAGYLAAERNSSDLDRHDWAFFNHLKPAQEVYKIVPKRKPSGLERQVSDVCASVFSASRCTNEFQLDAGEFAEFFWSPDNEPIDKGSVGSSRTLVLRKLDGLGPKSVPVVASYLPSWPGVNGSGTLCLIVLVAVLYCWIFYLARRMFFIDWLNPSPLDEIHTEDLESIVSGDAIYKHIMIIGHPKSGKSTLVSECKVGHPIDIASLASNGKWASALSHNKDKAIIILDHFEFGMDTASVNLEKLKLLEKLIYVEHRKVVILSTVDLMFYLASECPEIVWTDPEDLPVAIQVLDRWANLLSLFRKVRRKDQSIAQFDAHLGNAQASLQNPSLEPKGSQGLEAKQTKYDQALALISKVRVECNHTAMLRRIGASLLISYLAMLSDRKSDEDDLQDLLVNDVLDRADAYYRALWATCTKDERLVLFQLAKDGWVNPKNERAILELQRRNLVVRCHGFRVMNESFRKFVEDNQYPDEIATWEAEGRRSVWRGLRNAFILAGLLVVAWLAYSQQETFHVALGYIGAIGGAAVTLGGILSSLRSGRGSGNAPPGVQAA